MLEKDRQRLRQLAAHQMELAHSEENLQLVALWKRHNACRAERPLVSVEVGTFAHEAIRPRLQCEDPDARALEYRLLLGCVNREVFGDDWVVAPYFQVPVKSHFRLFGHNIKETVLEKADGTQTGHKVEYIISDLEADFDKILSPTDYGVDLEGTRREVERLSELFGDILPVRQVCNCLYAVPTNNVVHLMDMQTMLLGMMLYPDRFLHMMDRVADAYIAFFKHLEQEQALLQNHSFESLAQGSLCFWDEPEKTGPVRTTDLWGFLDSQETVGISPKQFHTYIFPCYQKIASVFGRLSYGCCEPVHSFWQDIKTLPNLKKVSISPWCDEEFMADQLRGTDTIYLRKPHPNFLGVGTQLDEDGFRAHIAKTVQTARGCTLEISQRDVYTVNRDMNKVRRYVQIVRECFDRYW